MPRLNKYLPKNIIEIVDELNKTYFLPDLQRPYEWTEEQVVKLFDSILRGYPISTFLIWQLNSRQLNEKKYARYKFVDHKDVDSELETQPLIGNECSFVLDGQQRLTALNIGIKGYITKRRVQYRLYFNLLSGKKRDEEDILYEFKFFPETSEDVLKTDGEIWARVSWLVHKSIEEEKRAPEIAEEIIPIAETDIHRKVYDNVDVFITRLVNGELFYYPEKEPDEDRVLDIFIRTNAGGTKLGYSDLLFSKIKVKWRGTTDARVVFKGVLTKLNTGGFDFDTDFILKTALVCLATKNEEVKFKLSNFDDAKLTEIEANWERLQNALLAMKDHLYGDLRLVNDKLVPSYNALIPLVSYAFANELSTFERKNDIDLKQYYRDTKEYTYRTLLTGAFGAQVDTTLWNIQEIISSNKELRFPTTEIFKKLRGMGKPLDIQSEVVEKISYGDKHSHLLLNLIYHRLNLDFKSLANQPQQDHIFSHDELKTKYSEEQIDDIANIRYVIFAENRWKSNTPFKEWIETVSEEDKKNHLIPNGDWNIDNYPKFLQERRKLIINQANRALE